MSIQPIPPRTNGPESLLLVYPFRGLAEVGFRVLLPRRILLPAALRSTGVTRFHCYYDRSDSREPRPGPRVSLVIPCFLPHVPTPTMRTRNHLQLWQCLRHGGFTACAAGFVFSRQTRHRFTPNRVHFMFGTALSLRAAPHPVSRRRSCPSLPPVLCLPMGNDFHILVHGFQDAPWRLHRSRHDSCGRCAAAAG